MSETMPPNQWVWINLKKLENQCYLAIAHGTYEESQFAHQLLNNVITQAIKDAEEKLSELPF